MIYIAGDEHGQKAILYVTAYLEKHHKPYEKFFGPLETILPQVAVEVKKGNCAIVSCGTGVGVEVGINKFSGIRAALATNPDIAKWAIEKDKCNVLCLVGWQATKESVYAMLDAWFGATYDGSEERLHMMKIFDSWGGDLE